MAQAVSLTDLQLAIMRILWERGACTVGEIQQALGPERRLALTTVATILTRLKRRGVVCHQPNGRQFFYRSLVTEQQVRDSMVAELTALLFDGSPAALVGHLLTSGAPGGVDLETVKRRVAELEEEREGR